MKFLQTKLEGPWLEFIERMSGAERALVPEADKTVTAIAEEAREFLTSNIEHGTFAFPPLGETYAARKSADVGDKPILMRTDEYVRDISVIKDAEGTRVGFPDGAIHSNGQPMEKIAKALEYGTPTVKSRPHWRPTLNHVKTIAPRKLSGFPARLGLK